MNIDKTMEQMNESDRVVFNEIIDNLYIINLTDYGKKNVINGVKDLQHQLEKQNSAIEEIKKYIKNIDEEEFVNTEHYVAILDKINELEKEEKQE